MTFVAVDDEPLALKLITKFAEDATEWKLLNTFTNAVQAADFIKTEKVDLVITDINMPDVNGIQFVKDLSEHKPLIIFLTAYKQHALEGFELEAIDYLLKPVSKQRFEKALEKAKNQLWLMQIANDSLKSFEPEPYFYVFSEYEQIKITISDICYIEGMGDYIKIFLSSNVKPVMTLERLKNIYEKLQGKEFVRIHRSYIINKNKITAKQKSKIQIGHHWLPVGDTYQDVIND